MPNFYDTAQTDTLISTAVAGLVDAAPGTLDTLNELAAALGDDANFAATVTAALAGKQPLDSDLTALAALTTTSYGRAFLELANQAGLMALVPAASSGTAGKIATASQAEVNTGTEAGKAVTPVTLQTRLAAYAQPLDSDLTAIAALTTTSFGRSLLTQADAATARGALGIASLPYPWSASTATIATTATARVPAAQTLTEARMRVSTAPVGSALTVVVQRSTGGGAFTDLVTLTIAAGSTTEAVQTVTTALSAGDLLRLNVTSVGSTTAATGVSVEVYPA